MYERQCCQMKLDENLATILLAITILCLGFVCRSEDPAGNVFGVLGAGFRG
jgi:hypothetical protein